MTLNSKISYKYLVYRNGTRQKQSLTIYRSKTSSVRRLNGRSSRGAGYYESYIQQQQNKSISHFYSYQGYIYITLATTNRQAYILYIYQQKFSVIVLIISSHPSISSSQYSWRRSIAGQGYIQSQDYIKAILIKYSLRTTFDLATLLR